MQVCDATDNVITLGAELIRAGKLVAFPTETVYGLGANAFDAQAIAGIFAAKERPFFDPLISHIAVVDFLPTFAQTDERVMALAKRFWPGPLTFVLKRTDHNAALDLACSGLPHIAVRMPAHPVALSLIQKSGVPIVAPSANKFKCVSPTTARHVADGLGDRVDLILDGGPCSVGVESTIIDVTGKQVRLLRAGGTAIEDIEAFLNEPVEVPVAETGVPTAPGQLLKHYAPRKRLRMNVSVPQSDEFFIGFGACDGDLNLSRSGDLKEAAAHLFAFMRLADQQETQTHIAVAPIPMFGLGRAINDRLRRASHQD